ncbi:ATP-binding protein [Sphingosinithalassobacter sp. CS137]|uniref:sensor histidine kinase n=1 Tax=Sphingosinithalassobacter sp. CS137 TaxID=2762748 RepID=UPI00165D9367|nr:ATP-binding protein [Sphingosinithalassobacter sp. CS137]
MLRLRLVLATPVAIVLAWLLAPPALAQAEYPPPLAAAFEAAKSDMMTAPDETLRHVARARAIAMRLPEGRQRTLALATARWLAAEAHWRSNDIAAAEPLVAEGLRLIEEIREPIKLRADLLQSRGMLNMQQDRAAQALADFQQAFRIFQQVGEPRGASIALQNIGALYWSANDSVRAERYYGQAAEVYGDDPLLSLSLHNRRGNVLLALERYGDAEAEFDKALELAQRLEEPKLEARVLGNLARNQVEAGRLDAAERTLSRGLRITGGADELEFRQHFYATAARVAQGRGKLAEARQLIGRAFEGVDLAETSGAFHAAHTYAYQIYAESGDSARALRHLEAVRRLKDEATTVATSTSAALMAARFDYANQELRIANQRVAYEQSRARWQRIVFYGLGGATLVVIALMSFGIVTLRRSRNDVRAANADLASTNAALEKALRAKTEFLATTSHEIRTPLNGILGMTQVMLSDSRLPEATRDRINVVHGAGVTMRALVDDILDVAKMETGNLTVDPVPTDLHALLREATRMWEEQARAKGLRFTVDAGDTPHWVVTDPGRLRQIVFNLLSNALKFTQAGGITVSACTAEAGEDRRLRIAVRDTGIGIPPEKHEEIFESFRQVDAGTTRRFGGTGLGLTICRNLACALGGDVLVESVKGKGTCFVIDLPLEIADAPDARTAAEAGAGAAVLVLDRNPIARSMFRTLLEPHAGSVRFVASVDEALAALAEGGVTRLLADEATLKASGDDSVAELRRLVEAAATAAVASTVLWSPADAKVLETLRRTGVGQILEKPVKGDELIAAIFAGADQNSHAQRSGPLVSHAA